MPHAVSRAVSVTVKFDGLRLQIQERRGQVESQRALQRGHPRCRLRHLGAEERRNARRPVYVAAARRSRQRLGSVRLAQSRPSAGAGAPGSGWRIGRHIQVGGVAGGQRTWRRVKTGAGQTAGYGQRAGRPCSDGGASASRERRKRIRREHSDVVRAPVGGQVPNACLLKCA
jgi:hypothetical protein